MYFQSAKPIEIPFGEDGNENLYGTQAMYEIEPELSDGNRLQFKSSMQYMKPIEPHPKVDGFAPTSAASIGIIGGADGPTSIFITTMGNKNDIPRGLH